MAIPRNLANFAPKLDSSGNPTFTAPTVFSAGTVSLPSITFTGDTNTGIFSPTADTIAFSEGGAEAMRIDSSGRLLVGATTARSDFFNTTTVAPRFQVELAASDNLNRFISVTSNNSDTGGAALLLAKSRGTTVGAVTIVQNDDQIGAISFQGADGVDMVEAARIYSHVDGTPGSNDMPGSLRFATTADGASSSTERARINNKGALSVNGTDGKGVVTTGGAVIDYGSGDANGIYAGGGQGNGGYGWSYSTLAGLGGYGGGASLAGGYFVGCTGISNVGGGGVGVYAKGGSGTVYGQCGAGIYAEAGADNSGGATSNYAIACRAYSYGVLYVDRRTNDGTLVSFNQDGTEEGTISVSGTTVSYNGGHLSRWSQLLDGSKDESILKGTVMSNLDEMCVWEKPAAYYTEYEEQNRTEDMPQFKAGDLKTPAEQSSNEQCNKTKVSDVEGDKNVAGVFVAWTYDDVHQTNDMLLGMTGDMVIRIGANVVVQRGDLLISAGNGTAKPQADDIRRSSTVAKVTSTNVSCTYPDGSYCVPCVLMAC